MNFDQNSDWKGRFNGIFSSIQGEIRKTTAIGFKMISASKLTGELQECYQLLGKRTLEAIKNGELEWRDPKVKILMTQIAELESILNEYEEDVQTLKSDKRS
jgi:hypothetical protein